MRNHIFLLFTLVGTATAAADEPVFYRDAIVNVCAANMRAEAAHSSELVSQAVMGTHVKLLDRQDGWWLVETPDGYQGYMIDNSLIPMDSVEIERWSTSPRVMYTGHRTGLIVECDGRGIVSDITPGSVIEILGYNNDSIDVQLPDGRKGRMSVERTVPLDSLGANGVDVDEIIAMARDLMGVTYLWGGTTSAAMDCSGLVKICYLNQGVVLPRDASQQAERGTWVGDDWHDFRRGDLVFFVSETTGKINHVGIYDRDGLYIHSAGRVRVNSLDPSSPLFIPSNHLAGATRIVLTTPNH